MTAKQKGWKELPIAGLCWKPSTEYFTGDWRTYKPMLDEEKCTKCLICYIDCPDVAVKWRSEDEKIEFDYNFCKGCGICANVCPQEAIKMVLE